MRLKPTHLVTAMATLFLLCSAPWLHARHITGSHVEEVFVFPVEDRQRFSESDRKRLDDLPIGGETAIERGCISHTSVTGLTNIKVCTYRKASENEVIQLNCEEFLSLRECDSSLHRPRLRFK